MKKLFLLALTLCAFRSADVRPTIFLIGDSTLADKPDASDPERGWGQALPGLLSDGVAVRNHAVNGRSTKSFLREGRWTKVLGELKAGDWVLIQFGHNDEKKEDSTRYAAPQTDYRRNLLRFIRETQAKGAKPVLLTPVVRRRFDAGGAWSDTHGDYPTVVKEVAGETGVPLIDLEALSRDMVRQAGPEKSRRLYLAFQPGTYASRPKGIADDTHFSAYGARKIAGLVVADWRRQQLPLAAFVRKTAFDGKAADELPVVYQPVFRKDTFRITAYGAKPDGQFLNTSAIQKSIDACSAAGGGTVLIPEGLWLTGPLTLKSGVNLHVKTGALLRFSQNREDYPLVVTSWEGLDAIRCQAPLSARNAVGIAITGGGTLDGGGEVWRPVKKEKLTASAWAKLVASGGVTDGDTWYPSEQSLQGSRIKGAVSLATGYDQTKSAAIRDFLRPNMVSLVQCRDVLLEGITVQNSPAWCLHPLLCEDITLRNVTVRNPWYAQNGDGVDLESCRHALIENGTFDIGDDAICIKSGRDAEGRRRGIPTEDVLVNGCTVFHGHGGFVVGSEMSGGARNLFVSNCTFLGTDVGLRFKTARGRGGVVEDVYVSGVQMTNIPGEAILFDMYYQAKDPVPASGKSEDLPPSEARPVDDGTPRFRHFRVQNVHCKGAETGILVRGLPEMHVEDIQIAQSVIESRKGLLCTDATGLILKDVDLFTEKGPVLFVRDSRKIVLERIGYRPGTGLLLRKSGQTDVRLLDTDTSGVKKVME